MRKPSVIVVAASAATYFAAPAMAERFGDWRTGFAQGHLEMWTENGPGNRFMISCDFAARGYGASIFPKIIGSGPQAGSDVRMFVDGEEIRFRANEFKSIDTDCHVCADNFVYLWERIREGDQLIVTFEDGRSSPFSLRGSSKALDQQACRTDFTGPGPQ